MASDVVEQLRTWDGRPVTIRMAWHGAPTEMLTFGALYGDDDATHELDGWTVILEGEKKLLSSLELNLRHYDECRVEHRTVEGDELPPEVFATCDAMTLRMSAKVDD